MDEPFGALDLITRETMTRELSRIWQQTAKTVVFVTHSIDEAIHLSDWVIVLTARPASILARVQIDLPRPRVHDLRESPAFHQYAKTLRDLLT
jgi:NitT/TauT family transport system ATP-binding protein